MKVFVFLNFYEILLEKKFSILLNSGLLDMFLCRSPKAILTFPKLTSLQHFKVDIPRNFKIKSFHFFQFFSKFWFPTYDPASQITSHMCYQSDSNPHQTATKSLHNERVTVWCNVSQKRCTIFFWRWWWMYSNSECWLVCKCVEEFFLGIISKADCNEEQMVPTR